MDVSFAPEAVATTSNATRTSVLPSLETTETHPSTRSVSYLSDFKNSQQCIWSGR